MAHVAEADYKIKKFIWRVHDTFGYVLRHFQRDFDCLEHNVYYGRVQLFDFY